MKKFYQISFVLSIALTLLALSFTAFNSHYDFADFKKAATRYGQRQMFGPGLGENAVEKESYFPIGLAANRVEKSPLGIADSPGISITISISPDLWPLAVLISWVVTIILYTVAAAIGLFGGNRIVSSSRTVSQT